MNNQLEDSIQNSLLKAAFNYLPISIQLPRIHTLSIETKRQ